MAELADALDSGSSRGNSVEVQLLLAAMIILFLLIPLLCWGEGFAVSPEAAQYIAEKVWKNECGGTVEGLTHWGKGENFPSLGIAHFIWYVKGQEERFEETFPQLVEFLRREGVVLPPWLENGCPWKNRDEFYQQISSVKTKELRELLLKTKNLQAVFIAKRLENTLPKIVEHAQEKEHVKTVFFKMAADPKGLYALIDYLNFKGPGISPSERYKGEGWGLLQVLQSVPASSKNVLGDFVEGAKKVLNRRVENSPPERNEEKWLKGWLNRVSGYLP
jgi:hypothetical protein